jgi:hypothetical protein
MGLMSALTTCRPIPLLADAGLSLTFLVFPFTLLLLFPIIGIEAVVIRRRLQCAEMWPVLRATTVANLLSTILGIPLTAAVYLLMMLLSGSHNGVVTALLEVVVWPWDASSAVTRAWAVPLADLVFLVLLVPYFLISVWSEQKVMERFLPIAAEARVLQIPSILLSHPDPKADTLPLRQAVRDANILSYVLMLGVFCLSALSFRA